MRMDVIYRRGGESRDAALHVRGAAPIDFSVGDFTREWIETPALRIAGGHDVGVAREDNMRPAASDLGEEIVDVRRAGLGKNLSHAGKARRFQRAFKNAERPGVGGRHRRTAQQFASQGDGRRERGHVELPRSGAKPSS